MAQHALELILARQLASSLATPIFLVDPDGDLIFYNEPAEDILGMRFEETGRMSLDQWGRAFRPAGEKGSPLEPHDLPLVVALRERRAVHGGIRIRGADGVERRIEVTGIPLVGLAGRAEGAMAIFWEVV